MRSKVRNARRDPGDPRHLDAPDTPRFAQLLGDGAPWGVCVNDRRYAIDACKALAKLGWTPRHRFEDALAATVRWYVEHRAWWERIISGEYLKYYERQYGPRR